MMPSPRMRFTRVRGVQVERNEDGSYLGADSHHAGRVRGGRKDLQEAAQCQKTSVIGCTQRDAEAVGEEGRLPLKRHGRRGLAAKGQRKQRARRSG